MLVCKALDAMSKSESEFTSFKRQKKGRPVKDALHRRFLSDNDYESSDSVDSGFSDLTGSGLQ